MSVVVLERQSAVLPLDVSGWMLENKTPFASSEMIASLTGCAVSDVPHVLRPAREAGLMLCVTNGGWVPTQEGLPPHTVEYLDDMMRHLGHPYYLGFAKAAGYVYGASHQAVQVTQVATSARLREKAVGPYWVRFAHKPNVKEFPVAEFSWNSPTFGRRHVVCSTAEVTLLDVVQRPGWGGSLYNVANIAGELLDPAGETPDGGRRPPRIHPCLLAEAAWLYPVAVRQRAGYILREMSEHMEVPFDLAPLRETIPARAPAVNLWRAPVGAGSGYRPLKFDYDATWRVRVDYPLDPDI